MSVIDKPHRLIVLLAALQAFAPLSIDMYLPGLPMIAIDLGGSETTIQQTITGFLVGLFIGMLFYGPLSDKYGRRKLLLGGMVVYIIATFGCIYAQSAEQLVLFRFLQALGGAATSVLGRAIVRDIFPLHEAAKVLSNMHVVTMIATIIAPVLGSYLLIIAEWRALFVVLAFYAFATLIFTACKIPETHHGEARGTSIWSVFAAYLRIAKLPNSMGYVLCMSVSFGGMFAYITASPFVYIEYFGVEPHTYALLFSLNIGAIILFILIGNRLASGWGSQKLLQVGSIIQCISGITLITAGISGIGGLPLIVVGLFGFVGLTGLLGSHCMARLLQLHAKEAGAAAGLATAIQFGLGAILSMLVSTLYDGTPLPMTLVVGLAGIGSFAALLLTRIKTNYALNQPV